MSSKNNKSKIKSTLQIATFLTKEDFYKLKLACRNIAIRLTQKLRFWYQL